MKEKFKVLFLEEAELFLDKLDKKIINKILYYIRKSRLINDLKLFKKLNNDIWEFRTKYMGLQYRLFAFWDENQKSLVVATHGIIKKTRKIKPIDLTRAEKMREEYLEDKKPIKKIKTYKLEEIEDNLIGKKGTFRRNKYEQKLKLEYLCVQIKERRKQRGLTESQLGELIDVKKSQIYKLERNYKNTTIGTLQKVFVALNFQVNFSIVDCLEESEVYKENQ
ncbi:MAG: XRE family transcriptional regulator [Flavobacteriaceae bacterium]|nr:XRE family transcriptional regulator [Flavobacteriaceae bacterium]